MNPWKVFCIFSWVKPGGSASTLYALIKNKHSDLISRDPGRSGHVSLLSSKHNYFRSHNESSRHGFFSEENSDPYDPDALSCLALAEDWDEILEKWWRTEQKKTPYLVQYLCIDNLKYCCPNGHFGPNCDPCPGYPDRICNNSGKCKGNGTRKGNGQCSCDKGYAGSFCDACDVGFYVAYKDDNKLLCSKCHAACKGACTQSGVKGCIACAEGWLIDSERGCIDINECLDVKPPCNKNQFCVNNEGSYSCLDCDPSCDGCSGDGPDMCDQCASGYVLRDNLCVAEEKKTEL